MIKISFRKDKRPDTPADIETDFNPTEIQPDKLITSKKLSNLEKLLSLREASELSGYHKDYLGQLMRGGDLYGFQKGRSWFTTQDALYNFLFQKKPERLIRLVQDGHFEEVDEAPEEPSPQPVEDIVSSQDVDEEKGDEISPPSNTVPPPPQRAGGISFIDSFKNFTGSGKAIARSFGLILLALIVIAGLIWFLQRGGEEQAETQTGEIPVIDLGDSLQITGAPASQIDRLVVNGTLELNGSFLLNPSERPQDASAGQMYFDQDTNQLFVFDGTSWTVLLSATEDFLDSIITQEDLAGFATLEGLIAGLVGKVDLQAATPGTAQTGNINITGTMIAGSFSGTSFTGTSFTGDAFSGGIFSGLSANFSTATGAESPQLLLLENTSLAAQQAIGLNIQSEAGGIGIGIDLSDADILTALALGDNPISVEGGTIEALELLLLSGRSGTLLDSDNISDFALTSAAPGGGLETIEEGTTLITSCVNGELLKWNGTEWICDIDLTGGGSNDTLQTAYNRGNTILTTDANNILFTLADTATDSSLIVDMLGTGNVFEVRDAGSPILTVADGGQVGINTAATNEALTLDGRLSLLETTIPTNTANYGKLYVKSSDSNLYFMDSSGNETNIVASAGLSGTGVAGEATFWTGVNTVSSDSNFFWDNTSKFLGIGTNAPQEALHVDGGDIRIDNGVNFANLTLAALTGDQTITVPDATGTLCLDSNNCNFQTAGNYFLDGGNSFGAAATLGTNDTFDLELETDATTRLTILSTGEVVIGAGVPNELLTVEGAFSMLETTAPTNTANYGKLYVDSTDSDLYFIDDSGASFNLSGAAGSSISGAGTDGQITFWTGASTVSGDDDFFWDNTAKRLGIGTNSPQELLHISGGDIRIDNGVNFANLTLAALTGDQTITIPDETGIICLQSSTNCGFIAGTGTAFVEGGNSFGAAATLGTNDTFDLSIETDDTDRITILSTGEVGIGTSGPNELLTVEGRLSLFETTAPTADANYGKLYIKSSDSDLYFMDSAGVEVNISSVAGGGVAGTGSAGQVTFWTGTNTIAGDNGFFWDNTAKRIGIGTTSPSEGLTLGDGAGTLKNLLLSKRDVATAGVQQASNDFILQSSVWDTTNVQAEDRKFTIRNIGGSGSNGLEPYRLVIFNDAGTEFATFDGLNQRMGLGRSSPLFKLDVLGDVRIEDELILKPSGSSNIITLTATSGGALSVTPQAASGGFLLNGAGAQIQINNSLNASTGNVLLDINASTGHTADLTRWRDSGGTTLAVVDASGQLGIGTPTPGELLHVKGGNIRFDAGINYVNLELAALTGNHTVTFPDASGTICLDSGNCGVGSSVFVQGGNSFTADAVLGTDDNFNLVFETNNTEQLRVDTSGNVAIGTAYANERLTVGDGHNIFAAGGSIMSPFGGFGRYENQLTFSEQLDNVAWTKTGLTAVTANATAAPDGSITADSVDDDGTGGGNVSQSAFAGATEDWTFSIWIKDVDTTGNLTIRITDDQAGVTTQTFDPANEWRRYTVTHTTAAGTSSITARIDHDSTASNSFYAWGAQLEQQSNTGVYAKTEGTAITTTARGAATGKLTITLDGGSSTAAICGSHGTGTSGDQAAVLLHDCDANPAADYMEMYAAEEGLETGDIVVPGTEITTTTDGDQLPKLTKTAVPYQGDIMGIISDPEKAGDFNSIGYNIQEGDNPLPLALNGRVKVKVSNENGYVRKGDYITSSSVPGVGMKATQAGKVVGMALEDFDCLLLKDMEGNVIGDSACGGKIMVFVNPGYWAPTSAVGGDSEIGSFSSEEQQGYEQPNFSQVSLASLKDLFRVAGMHLRDGVVAFKGLFIEKLFTRELVIDANPPAFKKAPTIGTVKLVGEDITVNEETGYASFSVPNDNIVESSKVFVTLRGDYAPASRYWLDWSAGEFIIYFDKAPADTIKTDFWIVGVSGGDEVQEQPEEEIEEEEEHAIDNIETEEDGSEENQAVQEDPPVLEDVSEDEDVQETDEESLESNNLLETDTEELN